MIEITAKLFRGPVYFSCERIKCIVTFKNVISTSSTTSDEESDESVIKGPSSTSVNCIEMLAWAGVQIYCHCSLDESKVHFIEAGPSLECSSSPDTSFNPAKSEKGHVVFSTLTRILFCGLSLAPGESRAFGYEESIPKNAPPSYYGSAVKYLYKLTIGTQRVREGIQLLRIPLRILPALDISQQFNRNNSMEDLKGHSALPRTPSEEMLDLVIQKLDSLTARKHPSSYVITNPFGQVAKFCLLKSSFKLGEDVIGIFNFTESTVPCVQFSVILQSEEVITEECKVSPRSSGTFITSHSKYHDFCLHTESTQIILPIPLTVTPAFKTNVLSLSWKLHFEFVTTKPENLTPVRVTDSQGVMTQSPANLDVQTMVWDLPLDIHPNHPVTVARGLQLPACSTLIV